MPDVQHLIEIGQASSEALDRDDKWISEEMMCDRCGFQWVSVYPEGPDELECQECGYMQPTGGIHA